jgi:hypothetical protein
MNTMPFHASIISDSGMELQRSQGFELIRELGTIFGKYREQVILHHCCSSQADNIGRAFAIKTGWRLEAHPAHKAAGMMPWRAGTSESQLDEVVHPARARADRDVDLIRKAHVVLAVESDWGLAAREVRQAEAAGREVIQIKQARLSALPTAVYSGPVHCLVDVWR